MNPEELHDFYEGLVRRLRREGVVCAITSGLACVHYQLAESTKDCDLLCHSQSFHQLLKILSETTVQEQPCRYRGNLSPPLEARWHIGGWTSHFQWGEGAEAVTLDVFGRALRSPIPWESDLYGLYAGKHIVAQMKRTNRDKDWPVITALGLKLVRAGDPRGWFHLFDHAELLALLAEIQPPQEIVAIRPALGLAIQGDPRAAGAIRAERSLWEELDRLRISIYERALRPYVVAVRKSGVVHASLRLPEEHGVRLNCAEEALDERPLERYGIERHMQTATQTLLNGGILSSESVRWLPDVRQCFNYLQP